MSEEPLVSIIIPTYNRAHLIGETLDSVLAQTYQNWECIVVDDGSTDDTDAVMQKYCDKDSRFKYYHRPDEHLPGGNGARNYGFKMSKGEYIQWFDSDDLMLPEKIELKVKAMLENDVDFVVSQTKYFNAPKDVVDYDYNFKDSQINFIDFTTTYVSWYTPDLFIKKKIVLDISFNENLKSGQEFNFISKLLLVSDNGMTLKMTLTKRRYANDSIGVVRRSDKKEYLKTTFENQWITFVEVYPLSGYNKKFGSKALLKCIRAYLEVREIKKPKDFFNEIIKFYNIKSLYFFVALIGARGFGKYHFFYKLLK